MRIDFYGSIAIRLVLGLGVGGFFGMLAAGHVWPEIRQWRTESWDVPVSGRVIDSSGGPIADTGTRSAGRMTGHFRMRFEYELDGRTYRTGQYAFGLGETTTRNALELPAKYRPGAKVSGWANPADPAQAVVVRGDPSASAILGGLRWLVFAVAIGAIGIGSAIRHCKRHGGRDVISRRRRRVPAHGAPDAWAGPNDLRPPPGSPGHHRGRG